MDITFPISGVHTTLWLPPLVAFCVSFFTSMVGISGAFLLLPFQMSVLGFISPAVSGTNLIFNIVAAPGGIFGFLREKRMVWPVAWIIVAGSVPGIVIGGLIRLTSMVGISGAFLLLPFQMSVLGFVSPAVSGTNLIFNIVATPGGIFGFLREKRIVWPVAWIVVAGSVPGIVIGGLIRLRCLPDPRHFKIFVGLVLLFIGIRLALGMRRDIKANGQAASKKQPVQGVEDVRFSWRTLTYRFQSRNYSCSLPSIFGLSLLVGVLGGVYGIGGGAIIAPFLVAIYNLPVYTIAGATLVGTFATSVAGAGFYQFAAPFFPGMQVQPDWMLGILFGLGGCCGTYVGARTQRYVSSKWLKLLLALLILFVSANYLMAR